MNGALKSPRCPPDTLNTPKVLNTPKLVGTDEMLSTPTLTTPKTADFWSNREHGQLFSPVHLANSSRSPSGSTSTSREPPTDLPLDSSIGLSSPHDGVLAKRRKLTKLHSTNSRSIESDSNSCDTPSTEIEFTPRDLSRKTCEERQNKVKKEICNEDANHAFSDPAEPTIGKVVEENTSPKQFKHPNKVLPDPLRLNKELSDVSSSVHPSPLAVPSPNWTAISALMTGEMLKTPKVLDNFVFDVLPPSTPSTPKIMKDRSPESCLPLSLDRQTYSDPRVTSKNKIEQRVSFADQQPRPHSLTPPPPYPEDLSMPNKTTSVHPKHEYSHLSSPADTPDNSLQRLTPPDREPDVNIKEEPRDYSTSVPPGFPVYYLHPNLNPNPKANDCGNIYAHQGRRDSSPPASPPRASPIPPAYPQQHQFYLDMPPTSLEGRSVSNIEMGHYDPRHHNGYALWHSQQQQPEQGLPPTTSAHVMPPQGSWNLPPHPVNTPPQPQISTASSTPVSYSLKSSLPMTLKSEPQSEPVKKKGRKARLSEENRSPPLDNLVSQTPPKKKGKGKGKNPSRDPNGPKRVFVCPHCQRSYDWNYNLNRHLKYECGKENAFMCSKCGRRFPHKQNCVYHLKRKHKIVCETIDQYVTNGLVVYRGSGSGAPPAGPSPNDHSPQQGSPLQ